MKNYIIRSQYDCLIKSNEQEYILDENSQIILDNLNQTIIYPLKENEFNYPFTINLKQECEKYKIFSFDDNTIIYLIQKEIIKKNIIEKVDINNKTIEINISEKDIAFIDENLKLDINFNDYFEKYSIKTINSFLLLTLIGKNESLYIYDSNKQKAFGLCGKKIEILDKKIFVLSELKDILAHEIYSVYEINNDELKKISDKFKIKNNKEKVNGKILPIIFLECLKIEDFETASFYLDEKLLEKTTIEHLKKYFGKIQNILPLEENTVALLNENETKFIKFSILNEKISEIEILP